MHRLEPASGELGQALVQPDVDRADRRGREAVAAQLLGDRLDPRVEPEGRLFRVDARWTCISARAAISAFSER
jgi:hypothetical protein